MTNAIETTAITTIELANILAEKTGSTKKAAKETIQIVLDTLTESLVEGKEVRLSGVGIFSVQDTAAFAASFSLSFNLCTIFSLRVGIDSNTLLITCCFVFMFLFFSYLLIINILCWFVIHFMHIQACYDSVEE